MQNFINRPATKLKTQFFGLFGRIGLAESFLAIFFLGLIITVISLALVINAYWYLKLATIFISLIFLIALFAVLLVPIPNSKHKIYQVIAKRIQYLILKKSFNNNEILSFFPFLKIEDDAIKLVNSSYLKVIKINGLDLSLLSEQEQDYIINSLSNYFKSIEEQIFIFKINEQFDLKNQIKHIEELKKYWDKQYKERKINKEVFYNINIQLNDKIDLYKSIENEQNFFFKSYYISIKSDVLKNIKNIITYTSHFLSDAKIGWKTINNQESNILIQKLFSPFIKFENNLTFSDFITKFQTDKIKFKKNHIESKSSFCSIKSILYYPGEVHNLWLAPLANLDNVTMITKIIDLDNFSSLKLLDKAIFKAKFNKLEARKISDNMDYDIYIENFYNLMEQIKNNGEKMKLVQTTFFVYGNSLKDLEENNNKFLSVASQNGFIIDNNAYDQKTTLELVFETNIQKIWTFTNEITNTALASGFPFLSGSLMDKNGLLLGFNYTNEPIFLDLKEKDGKIRNNHNAFVLGTSGQGKTYDVSKHLNHLFLNKTKIIILDPEADYLKFKDTYNAKIINAGSSLNEKINPLQCFSKTLHDHIRIFEEWFTILFSSINQYRIALIEDLLIKLYRKFNINDNSITTTISKKWPILNDLYLLAKKEWPNCDANQTQKELLLFLQQLSNEGSLGALWSGQTNFEIDNLFTIFNFYDLRKNKNVISAQTYLITYFIEYELIKQRDKNDLLTENKKEWLALIIDEAHLLINKNNPIALRFISEVSRRMRKYQGILIVVTQSIEEFLGSDETKQEAQSIINQSIYQIIHGLQLESLNAYLELNKLNPLSETEKNLLKHAVQGQALISIGTLKRNFVQIEATDVESKAWTKN